MESSDLEAMMNDMLSEQDAALAKPPGELTPLTQMASDLKKEIDEIEARLSGVKKSYESVKTEILRTMDIMEIDKVDMSGFLFYRKRKSSVTTPKTPEEKKELFDFLESQGIFLEIASVNAMTLNSLYKDYAEKALKEGKLEFEMPGVGKPTEYVSLEMRKSK